MGLMLFAAFADVGENHSGYDNGHGQHLYPFQFVEPHEYGRDGGECRQEILVERHEFRTDVFDGRLDEKIGYECRT